MLMKRQIRIWNTEGHRVASTVVELLVGFSPGPRWRFQTELGGNQDVRMIILFLFGVLKMAKKTLMFVVISVFF